ncbi:hypothetical protein Tco_0226642 [Tanacetum coccineum]
MFTACSCFIGGKDGNVVVPLHDSLGIVLHTKDQNVVLYSFVLRRRSRLQRKMIGPVWIKGLVDLGMQRASRLEYDLSSRHLLVNNPRADHGDPQSDTLQNELTFLIHSFMVNVIPSHRRINKCIWMSSADVLYVDIHIPYLDLLEKLSKDSEPITAGQPSVLEPSLDVIGIPF